MKETLLALAVAQSVDHERWDDSPVIPKDDSAVLTTLLPLVGVLAVYGAILLYSVQSPAVDRPMAEALISTRTP